MLSSSYFFKSDKKLFNESTLMQLILTTSKLNSKKLEFIKQIPTKKFDILKVPSNIYSFKANELAESYRAEIGIRTAIILGSMVRIISYFFFFFSLYNNLYIYLIKIKVFFIVIYVIWHNILKICRKFSRNGVYRSKPKKDYDLDYWLDYVDRMKMKRQNKNKKSKIVIIYSPKLPDLPLDTRLSTRDWIVKHKDTWFHMQNEMNWYMNDSALYEDYQEYTALSGKNLISSNSDIFQASDYRQTPNEISTTSFVKFKKFLKHPFRRKLAETNHRRVRRSIFYKDLEANAQLIDNYYKDILQNVPSHFDGFRVKRRSHSWPKCNKDFLKMHSLHLEKINQ